MIQGLLKEYRVAKEDHDDRSENRISKRLAELRKYKAYPETNPKQEFLAAEHERITNRLFAIRDGYDHWFNTAAEAMSNKDPEKYYNNVMGVKKLKDQLATIKFLLD